MACQPRGTGWRRGVVEGVPEGQEGAPEGQEGAIIVLGMRITEMDMKAQGRGRVMVPLAAPREMPRQPIGAESVIQGTTMVCFQAPQRW